MSVYTKTLAFFAITTFFFLGAVRGAEPVEKLSGASLDDFEKTFINLVLKTETAKDFFEIYPAYIAMNIYIQTYRQQLRSEDAARRDIVREKVAELLKAAENRTLNEFLAKFAETEPDAVQKIRTLSNKMKSDGTKPEESRSSELAAMFKKSLRTKLRTLNGETVIDASTAQSLFNSLFRVIAAFESERDFFLILSFSESFLPELLADLEAQKPETKKIVNFYNYFFEGCTGPEFLQKLATMDSFKELYAGMLKDYQNADEAKKAKIKERMSFYKSKVAEFESKYQEKKEQ